MSRRARAPKRNILPDPRFGSELLAKFMNMIMNDGKKSVAERIIYGALECISEKETKDDAKSIELLEQALREREANGRGKIKTSWWGDLSGPSRGKACQETNISNEMAY